MLKVVKSSEVIHSDDVFTITEHVPVVLNEEGETVEEVYDFEQMQREAEATARGIVEEADAYAAALLAKTQRECTALLEQARVEGESIRQIAYEQGLQDGVLAEHETIVACISQMELSIGLMEGEQAGLATEYEHELKWLALEIATRVIGSRIEADDTVMTELVENAVNAVKNAQWITVELSEQMTGLIDHLTGELRREDNERIEIRGINAPVGTCIVDTPQERLDASVYTQLRNLKEYFSRDE